MQRIVDGDDAVVQGVGYIKHLAASVSIGIVAIVAKGEPGWSDYQGSRIGTLRKTRADDCHLFKVRHRAMGNVQVQAQNCASMYDLSAGSDGAVQNIGDQQARAVTLISRPHIPGTID